jgi:hypothetical protein
MATITDDKEKIRAEKRKKNPNYDKFLNFNDVVKTLFNVGKNTKVKTSKSQPAIAQAQEAIGGNTFGTSNKDMADFYLRHPWAKKYDLTKDADVLAMQNEYNAMLAKRGLQPYYKGNTVEGLDGKFGDYTYSMPALEDISTRPTPELKPQSKFPDLIPLAANTALGLYGLNLANTKMPNRPGQPVFDRDNVLNTELAKAQVRSEMMSPQMLREMDRASASRLLAAQNNAAAASGGQAGSFASNVQQAALGNAGEKRKDLLAAEQMRLSNQQLMQNILGQRNQETDRLQSQAFHRSDQDLNDYRLAVQQANRERQMGRQMAANNLSAALTNIPSVVESFQKRAAAKKLGKDIEMKNQIAQDRYVNEMVNKDANAIRGELESELMGPPRPIAQPKKSINPIMQAMMLAEAEASKKRGLARREFERSPLNRRK